jgi:hypothetical protein
MRERTQNKKKDKGEQTAITARSPGYFNSQNGGRRR